MYCGSVLLLINNENGYVNCLVAYVWSFYCTEQGAVLFADSDSSRKKGLWNFPFTHRCISLSLKELPTAVIVSCRGLDSFTSSDHSLSIILLSPTTCTGRASQDGGSLLDKFIKSPPACCQDDAAPADYSEIGKFIKSLPVCLLIWVWWSWYDYICC